jgi:hypothetical protein
MHFLTIWSQFFSENVFLSEKKKPVFPVNGRADPFLKIK